MHKSESHLQEKEMHKILGELEIKTHHPIHFRPEPVLIIKKKRNCHLVDFAIPAECTGEIKESKKIDKYLDLA